MFRKKRKTYSRVKLSRAVSQILSVSHKEINELININKTERKTCSNTQDITPSTIIVPNRRDDLRKWVLNHNIARRSVNDLLKILKGFGLNGLTMDSRTLCRTPRFTNIVSLGGGEYWYNGIGTNIRLLFADIQSNATLEININVDGVPLMNSSLTQFWPILGNIHSE